VGLRQLAYWDCGFETRRRHGCLSVVNVVCCQVEVSMKGLSLVKRISTERCVSNSLAFRNLNNEEAGTKQLCPTMTRKKGLFAHCSNRLVQRKKCVSRFTLSCSYRYTCVTISNKRHQIHSYTRLLKMNVGVLTTCHKQYI
jgi:hypothetical protein